MISRLRHFLSKSQNGTSVISRELTGDIAGHILPIATAVMTFLAALFTAAALGVGSSAEKWSENFTGGLTIQLGPLLNEETDYLSRVLEMTRITPGIEHATVTSEKKIDELLSPWLGDLVNFDDLPKPRFIEVITEPGARLDPSTLEQRLQKVSPDIKVDDHAKWAKRISEYANAISNISLIAALLVCFLSFGAIGTVAGARIAIHADSILLLRQLGGSDHLISTIVAKACFKHTIIGASLGTGAALGTILFAEHASAGLKGLIPIPEFNTWHMLIIASLPLPTGGIAVTVSRLAALIWLRRI